MPTKAIGTLKNQTDRYGTRYTSRLSFPPEETAVPPGGDQIVYDIYLPPVSPPTPPPRARIQQPPRRKPKRSKKPTREMIERDWGDHQAWLEYYRERTPLFLFELREKVRVSYKPPPAHYRRFSKMVGNYFYPEKKPE